MEQLNRCFFYFFVYIQTSQLFVVLNAISFYDTNKNLEREAQKALEQIENKKYDTVLINEGIKEIIKIGLIFDGKKAVAYY